MPGNKASVDGSGQQCVCMCMYKIIDFKTLIYIYGAAAFRIQFYLPCLKKDIVVLDHGQPK